jgi:hypothetical protein
MRRETCSIGLEVAIPGDFRPSRSLRDAFIDSLAGACAVLDVVFLLAGIGLFAITVAYAFGCDRL